MSVPRDGSSLAVPLRRLDVRIRRFRGRLLVASKGGTHELSDTAAFIFENIDGQSSVWDIGVRLASAFGVPVDEAAADAAAFVDWLVEYEMVEVRGDARVDSPRGLARPETKERAA